MSEETPPDRPESVDRLERIDHAAGRIWRGFWGSILLLVGIVGLVSMLAADDFSLRSYWPGLLIDSLFFIAAIALFRSRQRLSDTLSAG